MARIVVLEDDASTRRLITAVLQKAGHEVTDVDNGAEGLLIAMAEQPDVVVSDVEMPKLTGFEVLQNIRQDPDMAATPVILLTSRSSKEDVREGMRHGADDYLTKPFVPAALLQSVNTQLAKLAKRRGQTPSPIAGFEASSPGELLQADLPELSLQPLEGAKPDGLRSTVPTGSPAAAPFEMPFNKRQAAPSDASNRSLVAGKDVGLAWALNLRVLNHEAVQARLAVKEWRLLLRQLFVPASKDAALRSADYLDLEGSSLTLYYIDVPQDGRSGAQRAALGVEAAVRSGASCRQWAAQMFPDLAINPVRVVVSLHMGAIATVHKPLDFGGERETVVGATAEQIARLRGGEPPLVWRVAATQAAVQAAKGLYRLGAQTDVSTGSQDVIVHAILGLNGDPGIGERVGAAHWI